MPTFKVRRFVADFATIGEIRLMVYRLKEEKIITESGDPVEKMVAILEREEKGQSDYVVVEHVEGPRAFGESLSKERAGRLLLFPKVVRLKRLAVIRSDDLVESEGMLRLKEGALRWIDVGEDVYVYDATIEAPEGVVAVFLETEEGKRIVRLGSLMTQGSSYSQGLQVRSDGSSESLSSEDSSPSS